MTASSPALSVTLVLAIALISVSAQAQVCVGASPFSNGHVRVGVGSGSIGTGLGSADGEPSLGFHVAAGAARGAFASVSASAGNSARRFIREQFAVEAADDALSGTVSLNGGYSVSRPTLQLVELCPIAGFGLQSGPSMWRQCTPLAGGGIACGGAVQGSARALWFGGNIGLLQQVSPGLAVVPFAGAAYVISQIAEGGRSHTAGYVDISLGAGLVIKRMTIRPTLSFPMGLEGSAKSVGFQFGVNIGPKSFRDDD